MSCLTHPAVTEVQSHGIYRRVLAFTPGQFIPGHKHNADHWTVFKRGTFKVTVEGADQIVESPDVLRINKHLEHRIEAMTDGEADCLFIGTVDDV